MLGRALKGLLAVIDEDYTLDSQADEPRIVAAHEAMAATAPGRPMHSQLHRRPTTPTCATTTCSLSGTSAFSEHPMNVHTDEPHEYPITLTKDGVLQFLNDEFGYPS